MEQNTQITTLNAVRTALPVYGRIEELYNAANNTWQMGMQAFHQRAENAIRRGNSLYLLLRWWVGTTTFGCLMLAARPLSRVMQQSLGRAYFPATLAMVAVFIGISVGACIGLRKLIEAVILKRHGAPTQAEENATAQLEAISRELEAFTARNAAIIDTMPRDYRCYDAVCFFEAVLANGRAENLKQAMDLYEEHKFRLSMEQQNNLLLQRQRLQSEMIASLEENAARAAQNAELALNFSILSFLVRA